MTPFYGRDALRRLREQQAAAQEPQQEPSLLEQIPADAPMDDATLTVWTGERFMSYDEWLATAPLVIEELPQERKARIAKGNSNEEAANAPAQHSVQEGLW